MPRSARTAVFHGPGRSLELCETALPTLTDGELLVRVRLCTLCGSDLHTYQGGRTAPTPTILGHEILGDVVELGPGPERLDLACRPVRVGDRITWSVAAHCGSCFFCTHDLPQKCERLFKYGHEPLSDYHPLSGGLAEYCHLTAATPVLALPAALPDEVACIANCATATVAGALRVAGPYRDQHVLILGAGMLGLNAAAMAHVSGARAVYVSDVDTGRLSQAERFGATACLPFKGEGAELVSEVMERTAGRGVDLALELSAAPTAMEASLRTLRIGGRVVFVGAVRPTRPLAIDGEMIVRRMLTIQGLHNYAPTDLAAAVNFLSQACNVFPFAELVSQPFPLAEADRAFQYAIASRVLRVAVRP